MPHDLLVALLILLAAAAFVAVIRYAIPKIELRGHSEIHNGIRVREVAFTWLRGRAPKATTQASNHWLECVVYVTLKS
jgi:hypothetical protein